MGDPAARTVRRARDCANHPDNPRLVLMDEPSDGLAPAADLIGEAIAGMKAEGVTLVVVEQDLHLAFRVAEATAVWTRP
jgi:ABC-type branched-subunit amino acid transport system ATPase component